MNYTVSVNESKKEIVVMLDGYKGVAKCCPTDNFNLGTGIELALERAKVAKANAEKPKPTVSVAEAIKVLENYVGDHIAIIGGGDYMSDKQKVELRAYADRLAPIDEDEDYDEDEYDCDEYEPNCGCHDNGGCECGKETLDSLAARMILRIREILGE